MPYQQQTPDVRAALEALVRAALDHFGMPDVPVVGLHIAPVKVCNACGCVDGARDAHGQESWVFPYHGRDRTGKHWDLLCNDCYDRLGCDDDDPEDMA